MKDFVPHLIFDGKSGEVINFYKNCFGGEILHYSFTTYKLIKNESDSTIYSKLKNNRKTWLIVSDGCTASICNGNQCEDSIRYTVNVRSECVVISINCESSNEFKTYYDNLAVGGEVVLSPDEYVGGMFGKIKDKYGIHWTIMFEPEIEAE